ncbi:MAG TPA: FAD-dependent oxidoreductase, partial [Nannocystis sp.]
ATGARELFLPFPGWTLPNVFGVGGAQALVKAGAPFTGKRVVVAGSGPLLLAVGATLASKGARVAIVAEQASRAALARFGVALLGSPGRILQAARLRSALGGARYAVGCWVTRADGDDAVREVTLTDGRRSWTEPCDVLCTGYGLVPNTELAEMLGCGVDGGRVRVDEWQRTSVAGVYCAGEPTGIAGVDAALAEGEIAGLHAASVMGAEGAAGAASPLDAMGATGPASAAGAVRGVEGVLREGDLRRLFAIRRREHRIARAMERAFAPRPELRELPRDDTILCRCEDVTRGMVDPAWSFRQAKLYTRVGMGPCQARVCGPACEFLFGWRGQTTRAPTAPAAVGTIAGGPEDTAGVA